MSKTLQTLLWEFWRPLKWRILAIFCIMLTLPAIVTIANTPPQAQWTIPINLEPMHWSGQMSILWINGIVCVLALGNWVGFPTRHYTLPISTRLLTFSRLLPGAFTCSGLHLLVAGLMNWSVNAGWPYVGPALTYFAGYTFCYAVVSRVYGRDNLRAFLGLGLGVLSGIWILGHYDTWWSFGPEFFWPGVSIAEWVVTLLCTVFGWQIAGLGFELDRKGSGWAQPALRNETPQSDTQAGVRTPKRFRSPFAALFWQESRKNGWLWPIGLACGLGMIASVQLTSIAVRRSSPDEKAVEIIVLFAGFLGFGAILPWFMGAFAARDKKSQYDTPLPTALSTLPISDATLAWVTIIRNLYSVAISWLLITAVGILWAMAHCLIDGEVASSLISGIRFDRVAVQECLMFVGWILIVAWMTTGVGAATGLSGRTWIVFLPIFFPILWIMVVWGMLLIMEKFDRSTANFLLWTLFIGFLSSLFVGSVAAYVRAWKRQVIGQKSLLAGLVILVSIEAIITVFVYCHPGNLINSMTADLAALISTYRLLLALAAAPIAVVPLAAHFNRHR